MRLIGNILWCVFCGLWLAIAWVIVAVALCVTIIGIPWGIQAFKFAGLALWPFNKQVVYGGGGISFLFNVLWLMCCGIPLAVVHAVVGLIMFLTIVGIPFGFQCFKLAKLALMPFGAAIV